MTGNWTSRRRPFYCRTSRATITRLRSSRTTGGTSKDLSLIRCGLRLRSLIYNLTTSMTRNWTARSRSTRIY